MEKEKKIKLMPTEKRNIVLLSNSLFDNNKTTNGFYKGFSDETFLSDVVELCNKHKIKWTYLDYYLEE